MPHVDTDDSSSLINDSDVEINPTRNRQKQIKKTIRSKRDHNSDDSACTDLWCDIEKVIKTVQLIQQDKASKHVLSLKSTIDEPAKSAELRDICSKMNAMIGATRSSDAARLKPHISQYAALNTFKAVLGPPIVSCNGRAEMGLNHPILTRWLCPVDALQRFDEDPMQAIEDLASGTIPMGAGDYPTLFWSRSMPGDDYDADNMLDGLFKSYFLVWNTLHTSACKDDLVSLLKANGMNSTESSAIRSPGHRMEGRVVKMVE
ncbi:hypothetical protein BS17DRAFT_810881 [Gyrodon lividus]|nr:hypothetical protein BS17DRAFT_810881 [Gyrodon lividus]